MRRNLRFPGLAEPELERYLGHPQTKPDALVEHFDLVGESRPSDSVLVEAIIASDHSGGLQTSRWIGYGPESFRREEQHKAGDKTSHLAENSTPKRPPSRVSSSRNAPRPEYHIRAVINLVQ